MFHLWVMGGSFAHFWFMLTVVAPLTSPRFAWEPVTTRPVRAGELIPIIAGRWSMDGR
jgi:hypothetical protein